MKTFLRNYSFGVLILILLGTSGCSGDNSTSPDCGQTRHGTTSAGRSFTVTQNKDSGILTLRIDGESPINLNNSYEGVPKESVQVLEHSSPLNIVEVRWESYIPRTFSLHYLFFEAGNATAPLIKGASKTSADHYYWVTDGEVTLSYQDGNVKILERFTKETRQEKCYADEKWLQREFRIHDGQAELLACTERYRTKTVAMGEKGCPDFSVNDAPWGVVNLTDALWKQRCPALRQGVFPPEF